MECKGSRLAATPPACYPRRDRVWCLCFLSIAILLHEVYRCCRISAKHMFKGLWYLGIIFAVCLSGSALNQQTSKGARADKEITIQVTASRSLVKLRPNPPLAPDNCEPTESQVRLYAKATSPQKGEMNFTWQAPVGRLIANKRKATWDLSGVEAGTYTATVEASDRHKHTASASITV